MKAMPQLWIVQLKHSLFPCLSILLSLIRFLFRFIRLSSV